MTGGTCRPQGLDTPCPVHFNCLRADMAHMPWPGLFTFTYRHAAEGRFVRTRFFRHAAYGKDCLAACRTDDDPRQSQALWSGCNGRNRATGRVEKWPREDSAGPTGLLPPSIFPSYRDRQCGKARRDSMPVSTPINLRPDNTRQGHPAQDHRCDAHRHPAPQYGNRRDQGATCGRAPSCGSPRRNARTVIAA